MGKKKDFGRSWGKDIYMENDRTVHYEKRKRKEKPQ